MREFVVHQLCILGLVSVLSLFDTWQTAVSIALGGLLMTGNLLLLAFSWRMISRKKLIALNLLIIVSKYTILAVVLFQILSLSWIRPVAFMIGVSLFVISTMVTGLFMQRRLQKKSLTKRLDGRRSEVNPTKLSPGFGGERL